MNQAKTALPPTSEDVFNGLSLYYRPTCPYCRYVLAFMKSKGIELELRNISDSTEHASALIQQGGKQQVPCLRVQKSGIDKWMYESSDIVDYLEKLLEKANL